jgi:hypothetical protein
MEQQLIYTQDYIGLATLDNQGRLYQTVASGVGHMGWIKNEHVFVKYLLQWLS